MSYDDDWDDDEDEVSGAFEWSEVNILHGYAWKASQGAFPLISRGLGFALIDAIKVQDIDDICARPYIAVLHRVAKHGGYPRWE